MGRNSGKIEAAVEAAMAADWAIEAPALMRRALAGRTQTLSVSVRIAVRGFKKASQPE